MVTSAALQELQAFRSKLYGCCTRRRDALFELVDALLTAGTIPSLAYLSLEPIHRRGWGSTYAALAAGQVDAQALRTLLASRQLAGGQPIFAVDVSTWPRCDAEASPARGFYYHPSRHSAGQPIVAGWAYQWIAQLGVARDSWTAPVDARRLHPRDNANQVAVTQVRALVERLPAGQTPLFVFDAGDDPVQLGQGLAGTGAAILVRLRAGRCFDADRPPAPRSHKGGRPRRHGAKLDTDDPTSWPAPTAVHVGDDGQFGTVIVQAWEGLHPKQQLHPTRGTKRPRPIVGGTWSACRSAASWPGHVRPKCYGYGGRAPARPTWGCCGGPTCAASTSSTPSASVSRPLPGPPQGCGIPNRPIDGPGWSWPPTPSSA
jgi:hypothetical protein